MQKFIVLALCVAAAAASVITPKGVVSPVTRCGGVGTFIQLRVAECDGFCYFTPGKLYAIEADIIPSTASPSLTLKVQVRVFGSDINIVDTVLPNSSVQPGQIYTIHFSITPNDILSGQIVVITSTIAHTDSELVETCLQHNVMVS